jgi:hypothetical protein
LASGRCSIQPARKALDVHVDAYNRATLTMSGSSFTITLGTPSGGGTTAAAGTANVSWTPSALATDLAGNPAATTVYTETDNDTDF